MFDIGFWELALLAIIALIVLGPERLPVVARTLGRWVGRARGYMDAITTELEQEVRVKEIRDEVKKAREQIEAETRNVHDQARKTMDPIMRPLDGDTPPAEKPSAAASGAATGTSASSTSAASAADAQPDAEPPPPAATSGDEKPAEVPTVKSSSDS